MNATKVHVIVYRHVAPGADPQILLLKKGLDGHSTWNFLAEYMDAGESPAEAAARATTKDTGLEKLGKPQDLAQKHVFASKFTNKTECEQAFAIQSQNPTEQVIIDGGIDCDYTGFQWVDAEEAYMLLQWDSWKESLRLFLQTLE